MSTKTSTVYGYGVDKEALEKVTVEKLVEFMKNYLPKDYEQMLNEVGNIEDTAGVEAWLDEFTCLASGENGRYAIISAVLQEKTRMRFAYHDSNTSNEMAVMLEVGLPWQFNQFEKDCIEEDLDNIFKKYFSELGVDVEPCDVSVEYFG